MVLLKKQCSVFPLESVQLACSFSRIYAIDLQCLCSDIYSSVNYVLRGLILHTVNTDLLFLFE